MPTDPLTLPKSERDRLAAVHVMKWRRIERSTYGGKVAAWYDDEKKMEINHPHFAFRPSQDANDDYLILRKVRETWSEDDAANCGHKWLGLCGRTTDKTVHPFCMAYEPGMWRDAALLVLAEKGEI